MQNYVCYGDLYMYIYMYMCTALSPQCGHNYMYVILHLHLTFTKILREAYYILHKSPLTESRNAAFFALHTPCPQCQF